jgi:hypothetical protein
MKKKYIIKCRETGTVIEEESTLEEAMETLEDYEKTDKKEGNYTLDFYEIVEEITMEDEENGRSVFNNKI